MLHKTSYIDRLISSGTLLYSLLLYALNYWLIDLETKIILPYLLADDP